MRFGTAGVLALIGVPSVLGAQQVALVTGGGIAQLDNLASQPISTLGLSASGGVGPVQLGLRGASTNYRDLGTTNKLYSALQLNAKNENWTVRGGPSLAMGSSIEVPWTSAWSVDVGVARTLGPASLEISAAEGVAKPGGKTVNFGRRGAGAQLSVGILSVGLSYDLTIMRDSTLLNDVFFDPGNEAGNSNLFRNRTRNISDAALSIGADLTTARLRATLGSRSGNDISTQTFWELRMVVPVGEAVSFIFSTSRDPADVVLGQRGGKSTTLGFRLALPDRETGNTPVVAIPAVVLRETPQLVRVVLTIDGGTSATLMGELTGWKPVSLQSLGNGKFEGWFRAPPGTYRVNISLDGGPWIAPPGMPRIEDGFGGTVGLLDL